MKTLESLPIIEPHPDAFIGPDGEPLRPMPEEDDKGNRWIYVKVQIKGRGFVNLVRFCLN